MRKAQITGQIFIYIMVIIVVGLIFLLGYNYVAKILDAQKAAEKAGFVKTIEENAEKYDGYNEVSSQQIKAPGDYVKVCFVDAKLLNESAPSISMGDPVIEQSVAAGVEQNIFLVGKETEPVGFSAKIKVAGDVICIDRRSSTFNIKFLGDSDQVEIETFS